MFIIITMCWRLKSVLYYTWVFTIMKAYQKWTPECSVLYNDIHYPSPLQTYNLLLLQGTPRHICIIPQNATLLTKNLFNINEYLYSHILFQFSLCLILLQHICICINTQTSHTYVHTHIRIVSQTDPRIYQYKGVLYKLE